MTRILSQRFLLVALLLTALAGYIVSPKPRPTLAAETDADKVYTEQVRPLFAKYCFNCHSDKLAEADIDLQQYAKLGDVRKATRVWQKVAEMLDSGQMPPKQAKQFNDAEKTTVRTWLRGFLKAEAQAHAGDPGRVTMRRLSNAEYTYTIHDLTGVPTLQPTKEFPLDGAAGEGFTNAGDALVMSPALVTKYLDAAKDISAHAVLLPDGIRFAPSTSRRDWTNDVLAEIRNLYAKYTVPGTATKMNLQGVIFDEREGGRLPLEKYLAATIKERDALQTKRKTFADVARENNLSAVYLEQLWHALTGTDMPLLLGEMRNRWATANVNIAGSMASDYARLQASLWKTNTVGHIGRLNGPKSWMEPVDPTTTRQELRYKIAATPEDAVFYLGTNALDKNANVVIFEQPKFVAPGQPEVLLRDVQAISEQLLATRTTALANTAKYLHAATEATPTSDIPTLAKKHDLDTDVLRNWLSVLGLSVAGPVKVQGHYTKKMADGTYKFITGWGSGETPLIIANSSDQHVRVPGNMKPHSVAVHPSPTLHACVGWQSPVAGVVKVQGKVQHAHPECGNGVVWTIERRHGTQRDRLATGIAQGGKEPKIDAIDNLKVQQGDVLALVIGPRDGNHSCDLTEVDLTITADGKTWNLAKDVSSNIQDANPHADSLGNKDVWHFYTEPVTTTSTPGFVIPAGSALDTWRQAKADAKAGLADAVRTSLTMPTKAGTPDALLQQHLTALNGPLFGSLRRLGSSAPPTKSNYGLATHLFGKQPLANAALDAKHLAVMAGNVLEVRVPKDMLAGYEFQAHATVATGAAQVHVTPTKPDGKAGLNPGRAILVAEAAKEKLVAEFNAFRELFPPVVCYSKIVPVDEVVTLTLYYREDHLFAKLFLNDAEKQQLQRLWDELHYISQDALTQVDAFHQLLEYASQDSNPKLFEPLRKPIYDQAAAFKKLLLDSEPRHMEAVLTFAAKAYRRPLTNTEKDELHALYKKLRAELPHEQSIRLTLAKVLVSPLFLYRGEKPNASAKQAPVSDVELATRLSYFLWASAPDDALMKDALAGKLHEPATLNAHMKRLLSDYRTHRFAKEFALQWLHIANFDTLNEKSEKHFPTFLSVRNDMQQESLYFFLYLLQNNGRVLDIIDSDFTFLNENLAKHYGIPGLNGTVWRKVDGIKKYGRGGIFAHASTLTMQSGASRTSPILRGTWLSEVILGEKLPKPPKGVPTLPEDEQTGQLTQRQLVEKHSSDAKCAVCHQRIDPYGFSLEAYDAIGRVRTKDLGNRPIDTKVKAMDGASFEGLDGLRNYLLTQRRDAFVRQFCKKLLGYALGRAVQLSDEPLLDELDAKLKATDYRLHVAIETIINSRQFRDLRGAKYVTEE